jgi:RsiW-degrading membrane proteinase PrsW (M82 family)
VEESLPIRRSIWFSSIITLAAMAVFVGISAVIPRPGDGTGLLVLGLFLALIPAIVWIAFFLQQDRSEPEPKRLIARTFAFGALAAGAAAIPFASYVTSQSIAYYSNPIIRLILTILSISLMQEVLKVAMVRYVVLGTSEFDRHPDGIVYGLASGIGFATVMTVAYILQTGGVVPLAGAIRAVDNALVHGALGAVSGYYLGRVKIDGKNLLWMMTGLTIVTVVNGAYQVAQEEFARQLAFNPWYDLAVAAAIAVAVGVVLFAFFRRALRRAIGDLSTVSVQAHARSREMPWDIALRYDWLLVGAAGLALVVGVAAGAVARSTMLTYDTAQVPVTFRYPARWAVESGEGRFSATDLSTAGVFKPTITVEADKVSPDASLDLLVAQRSVSQEQSFAFYTEVQQRSGVTVGGQPAIQVEYQYAAETSAGPAVVTGVETLVMVGDQLFILRYEAEPGAYAEGLPDYQRLLRSARFEGAR